MNLKILFFLFVLCISSPTSRDKNPILCGYSQNRIYVENLLPKGYVKDGSVDYTNVIQKALNEHDYIILPNFPVLVNDTGLKLKSNSVLEFQDKSILELKTSTKDTYNILEIHNVENVQILNPNIVGDRVNHLGKGGEHGMGIAIRSSKNIKILNANIKNCWGDGIYIGRLNQFDKEGMFVPSENINIEGAHLERNRRNALSLTSGKNIIIRNLIAINTNGTAPMAGIDIEPNANKDYLEGVILENILTENNRYGIQLCLKKMVGVRNANVDVIINNHIDNGSKVAFRIDKFDRAGKQLNGRVKVVNAKWKNNQKAHLSFAGVQDKSSKVVFSNVKGIKGKQIIKDNFVLENNSTRIRNSISDRVTFR